MEILTRDQNGNSSYPGYNRYSFTSALDMLYNRSQALQSRVVSRTESYRSYRDVQEQFSAPWWSEDVVFDDHISETSSSDDKPKIVTTILNMNECFEQYCQSVKEFHSAYEVEDGIDLQINRKAMFAQASLDNGSGVKYSIIYKK